VKNAGFLLIKKSKLMAKEDITKTIYCKHCKTTSLCELRASINAGGHRMAQWICTECNRPPRSGQWIAHQKLIKFGIDIAKIKIYDDAAGEVCCRKCGALFGEYHHWAPRHLFGDDADKWPGDYLCQKCHREWHNVMTPDMSRKENT